MKCLHLFVNLLAMGIEISPYFLAVDNEEEGEENEDEEDSRQAMRPNIDTFIMDHKETFEYFGRSIEINSISVSYAAVIFHELWSFL